MGLKHADSSLDVMELRAPTEPAENGSAISMHQTEALKEDKELTEICIHDDPPVRPTDDAEAQTDPQPILEFIVVADSAEMLKTSDSVAEHGTQTDDIQVEH